MLEQEGEHPVLNPCGAIGPYMGLRRISNGFEKEGSTVFFVYQPVIAVTSRQTEQ